MNPLLSAKRLEKAWDRLTLAWAAYFLAIFTVGTIPAYKALVLWGGGALVGVRTFWMIVRHVRFNQIPRETLLLVCFCGWSFLGVVMATDMAMFSRVIKLTLEMAAIVFFVGTVLMHSGKVQWFYVAFLGVAVWRTLNASQLLSGDAGSLGLDMLTSQDGAISKRFFEANAVGVLAAIGFMSMLALLRPVRNIWLRGVLIGGGVLALAGVVLSASRGAFVTLIAVSILWPLFCLGGGNRFKLQAILGSAIAFWLAFELFEFIVANTYLGTRFVHTVHMEDESSLARFGFVQIAFRLLWENPFLGVGAGQFGVASGTGYYAHNEFAEIIATTGLPGTLLYYSIYWMSWMRLSWSLKFLRDPDKRYYVNMARVTLLILMISGFLFRPNYQLQDTMFLIATVIGMAHWAERSARQVLRTWPAGGLSVMAGAAPGFPGPMTAPAQAGMGNPFLTVP